MTKLVDAKLNGFSLLASHFNHWFITNHLQTRTSIHEVRVAKVQTKHHCRDQKSDAGNLGWFDGRVTSQSVHRRIQMVTKAKGGATKY